MAVECKESTSEDVRSTAQSCTRFDCTSAPGVSFQLFSAHVVGSSTTFGATFAARARQQQQQQRRQRPIAATAAPTSSPVLAAKEGSELGTVTGVQPQDCHPAGGGPRQSTPKAPAHCTDLTWLPTPEALQKTAALLGARELQVDQLLSLQPQVGGTSFPGAHGCTVRGAGSPTQSEGLRGRATSVGLAHQESRV